MNHYVGWLHEVGKLVYIIGSLDKTTQVKAKLDPNDSKYQPYKSEIALIFAALNNFQETLSRKKNLKCEKVSWEQTGSAKYLKE